jgi:hypothetical protein
MSCFQGSADKLRAELRVVESEKKTLQEEYLRVTERVSQLETELDKANFQIRLLQTQKGTCENRHRPWSIFCHVKVGCLSQCRHAPHTHTHTHTHHMQIFPKS